MFPSLSVPLEVLLGMGVGTSNQYGPFSFPFSNLKRFLSRRDDGNCYPPQVNQSYLPDEECGCTEFSSLIPGGKNVRGNWAYSPSKFRSAKRALRFNLSLVKGSGGGQRYSRRVER